MFYPILKNENMPYPNESLKSKMLGNSTPTEGNFTPSFG
jgi:hypothetical protein